MGGGQEKDQGVGERSFSQGKGVGGDHGVVGAEKKSRLDLGQRRGPVRVEDRGRCIELVQQARASGARRVASCEVLEVSLRTVERWEKDPDLGDRWGGAKSVCGSGVWVGGDEGVVGV